MLENGVGHIREKWVGQLGENSGLKVGHFPENSHLDNSHFWNIKLDTCGITTFNYQDKRFILEKHNDTSFLKSIVRPTLSDF
jgi:hypothetical protein